LVKKRIMTTIRKSHRQEVAEAPPDPEVTLESPPVSPADQFQKYRDAAGQLEAALKTLDARESAPAQMR
jgi:hypothetical protein